MGRNLIPYLLEQGDSVVALSRSERSDGRINDAAAAAGSKVELFRGGVNDDTDALARGECVTIAEAVPFAAL